MVITVEMYGQVRQMYLAGVSQRQIARTLQISRNTVKKYCDGDNPPWERKKYTRPTVTLTDEVKAFVQTCLKVDEMEGLPKQRHTARRIYDRLVDERNFDGGETTIRRYVHELRGKAKAAFLPLTFAPGEAMQIDWGETSIRLNKKKITVNLFCARLCHSSAPFIRAYRRQNSESFLDALVHTIQYFGGVSRRVIFDNAKVAVKDGFGAKARVQENYAMLAAHYGFKPVFCNVASGNEKGLVEGLVGLSRRNFCVPVPQVESMEAFNNLLKERCQNYLKHHIRGKSASVGELFEQEVTALYPLPKYQFDPAKRATARVSLFSTARFDKNSYSVPVKLCGKEVAIKALPDKVEFFYDAELVASHQRCFASHQNIYDFAHYLPLLEKKGRAIFQASPVKNNAPAYFLDWLEQQKLSPKELVEMLKNSLIIGFDAVMRGEIPPLTATIKDEFEARPAPEICDAIAVTNVDLSAYDALYRSPVEIAACL